MKRGVWIAILVVLVIILALIMAGAWVVIEMTGEPSIPQQAYLEINLRGPLVDSLPTTFAGTLSSNYSLRDLWVNLERARRDTRIRGVILNIGDLETGLAKMEDLGRMLQSFKKSRKPVIAYLEEGGLKEYYLASFCDKVLLFKGTSLMMMGLAGEALFLKGLLGKLGIQADLYHVGAYKTYTSLFTQDHMTPPHRESLQVLLDDIQAAMVAGIARNRQLSEESVRSVLARSPLPLAEYLKAKWVDRIGYRDEMLNLLPKQYPTVDFWTYSKTSAPSIFSGSKKIAVIFASGEIRSGRSGGDSIFGGDVLGADSLAEELRTARKNYAIKAVVLRIDSPGGSAIASDVILREAELLAAKKPLVVSMSDMAASGGYWISLGAAQLYALPQTITGSIGVVSGKFVLKGLYDKIGIQKEQLRTTPYAGMYSDYTPFSAAEREKVVGDMNRFYQEFLNKVSHSRKMSLAEVEKVAQGRVWSGSSAKQLRLVDQLGNLEEAIAAAKKLARIPEYESVGLRLFPRKKSFLDFLLQLGSARDLNPLNLQAKFRWVKDFFPALIMPFVLQVN